MSAIPANEVTQEDLNEWYRLSNELSRIKAAEMLLRTKIFRGMFKDPVEGTNTVPLAEGWQLKGKRTINRDIDPGSLQAYVHQDEEGKSKLSEAGIAVGNLIKWKPELILKNYRQLTDEQRNVFDNVLIIKDGSPALEIVLPKRAEEAPKLDNGQA